MKRLALLSAATLLLAGCQDRGSPPGTISGSLTDLYTGAPLAGVEITLVANGSFTQSDASGHYELDAPPGTHTLALARAGYLDLQRVNVVVSTGRGVRADVAMFEEAPSDAVIDAYFAARDAEGPQDDPDDPGDLRPEMRAYYRGEAELPPPVTDAPAVGGGVAGTVAGLGAAPATIRVWRRSMSSATTSCAGVVQTINFEDYVRGVLPHEWIPSWSDESLTAGGLAIRTYSWNGVLHPKYTCADLDDTTRSQVYADDRSARSTTAVNATAGQVITRGGSLVSGEYSAENANPTADGISDPLCAGHARFGHGRGMCQWGSQRWATRGGHDHTWIAEHYWPGSTITGAGSTPPTPPPPSGGRPKMRNPFERIYPVTEYVLRRNAAGNIVDFRCSASGGAVHSSGHTGTDFGSPRGTPVLAAANGNVFNTVDGCPEGNYSCGGGFGNQVLIQHAMGRASLYGHLQSGSGLPRTGTSVNCGDRIGLSGNTGHSTGPHLHFELRDGVSGSRGSYFGRGPTDPWPGPCSTQMESQWAGGNSPQNVCDGAAATPPRDEAQYVSSSIGTSVHARPGQMLTTILTMRNSGTTRWTTAGYDFRFATGTRFTTDTMLALSADVPAGGTTRFTVHVTAPSSPGSYRGTWHMVKGTAPFPDVAYLTVIVDAPPTPRGCHSATLGRNVNDGECVQVSYPGCGSDSCGWYQCNDGAWGCTPAGSCRGAAHMNSVCTPPVDCTRQADCGTCTAARGCTWCADSESCVSDADAGSCTVRRTDPQQCSTCQADGRPCLINAECCNDAGSSRCLAGFCIDTSMCSLPGEGCASLTDCCSSITCQPKTFGGSRECCFRTGDTCTSDAECCGEMGCVSGRCACHTRGQPCASLIDCCGGSICIAGSCT